MPVGLSLQKHVTLSTSKCFHLSLGRDSLVYSPHQEKNVSRPSSIHNYERVCREEQEHREARGEHCRRVGSHLKCYVLVFPPARCHKTSADARTRYSTPFARAHTCRRRCSLRQGERHHHLRYCDFRQQHCRRSGRCDICASRHSPAVGTPMMSSKAILWLDHGRCR